jgi:hypothetical protein
MALKKAKRPGTVATVRRPRNGEQIAGLAYFNNATPIALQSKKLAARFGFSEAAALALAPLIFGEAMQ